MTKTFKLNKIDNHWYGESKTKMVCNDLIRFMINSSPEQVTAVVSDEPFEEAKHVLVCRTGYYRWSWRFSDCVQPLSGMRRQAEDVLGGMFNRLDREKQIICEPIDMAERSIWLRVF